LKFGGALSYIGVEESGLKFEGTLVYIVINFSYIVDDLGEGVLHQEE
jgi:hypothetical protein